MNKELVKHWLEVLETPNWEEHMKYCGPKPEDEGMTPALYQVYRNYNKLHKEIDTYNQGQISVYPDREGNCVTLRELNDSGGFTPSQMADLIRYFT